MERDIARLKEIVEASDNIVFFGGAGVSTESGIPDFRSKDGLYRQKQEYGYPAETILSHSFFMAHPDIFFQYYREARLASTDVMPNAAHYKLAEWERQGKLTSIVTQNIDGLHQLAGSKNVLELHGSMRRYYCMRCRREHPIEFVKNGQGIPYCACGGIVRPDVVLFEESLDTGVLYLATHDIEHADVLIIGGTSLSVYPAAGLIYGYRGDKLILINRDETPGDSRAALVIRAPIGEVLSQC